MCRTSTPAAVSLTVILTPASARYYDNENLRSHTVLHEAMLMIDPVVYYGDIDILKDLKGERLREAAIGSTAVLYTPFGCWKDDSYGEDDEYPLKDGLAMTRYLEGTTIVNGWLENGAPTRQEYWRDAEEAYYSSVALHKKAREDRKLLGTGNTPLRSVMTADGEELRIVAKQNLFTDASGLVRTAALSSHSTATPSPTQSVIDDDLFKNANWADDVDDEDVVGTVTTTHTSLSARSDDFDGLFKNANWADDIDDDEDEVVPVARSPPANLSSTSLTSNELLAPLNLSQDADNASTKEISTSKTAPNFLPVVSDTGRFCLVPVVPIPQRSALQTQPEENVLALTATLIFSSVQALEPCSNEVADAEEEEMYGSGSGTTSSGSLSVEQNIASSTTDSSLHADQNGILQGYAKKETWVEDDFAYPTATAGLELGESAMSLTLSLPFRTEPVRSSMGERLTMPVTSKEIAESPRDMTTADYLAEGEALMARIRRRFSPESAEASRVLAPFAEEDEPESEGEWEGDADVYSTVETEHEQDELVAEEEDSTKDEGPVAEGELIVGIGSAVEDVPITASEHAPPKQVLAIPRTPDSATWSPSDFRDRLPTVVSSLKGKKNRSPCKALSVEQDHRKVMMPKFSLVPPSMESMIRHHAEKLDEIEERKEEDADSEAVSEVGDHFTQTTGEEDGNAKLDLAALQGHVALKRSPFIGNLADLVEDDSSSEPVTPERSPVPSPYKRPASNTPKTMLGKRVKFSFSDGDDEASGSDEFFCTRGVGAIFEDDEEDDEDDGGILSGVVVCGDDHNVQLRLSLTSCSVRNLPEVTISSGSGSGSKNISTAQSKESTAPTTVEGSEEGSPSPSIIARPAKRPVLMTEPSSESIVRKEPETLVCEQPTLQKHKSNWSSIKATLSKKAADDYTGPANVPVQKNPSAVHAVLDKSGEPSSRNLHRWSMKTRRKGSMASARP